VNALQFRCFAQRDDIATTSVAAANGLSGFMGLPCSVEVENQIDSMGPTISQVENKKSGNYDCPNCCSDKVRADHFSDRR
jgi:hypothetical protein